jgi:hypothetical protein
MSVNFQSLLSKPADEAKRPQAKPAGTYFGTISEYKFDESKKQKTPYVRFTVKGISPGDDVDQSALAGDAENGPIDLTKWSPNRDFYLTDDALYRLKDLLESCKIDTKGRSWNELIPQLKGQPVMLTVTQRPSEDGTQLYNDVTEMKGAG